MSYFEGLTTALSRGATVAMEAASTIGENIKNEAPAMLEKAKNASEVILEKGADTKNYI